MSTQISDIDIDIVKKFIEDMENSTEEEQKIIATEFYKKYVSI
jgi:hypothetical protein|tara:strand:+ start:150 stop:278 length:129 start_codon:yes stop_codon:yes gene_type:complete